jgi:uncharacterized protein (DUF2147 family)
MKLVFAVAALAPLVCSAAAQGGSTPNASVQNAGQWSPVGLWQAVDSDTKQPIGWFLIDDHNGVFDGIIAKMFLKPGEDPNTTCDKCKDDRKDHSWLGLEIIRGMKPEGENKYGGGTILDPRDGKIYKATMKVTPDGQTLVVRGYIGFELLGQNQYWTRLPDAAYTTLDPSVNPQYIHKAVPPPAQAQTPRKSGAPGINPKRRSDCAVRWGSKLEQDGLDRPLVPAKAGTSELRHTFVLLAVFLLTRE